MPCRESETVTPQANAGADKGSVNVLPSFRLVAVGALIDYVHLNPFRAGLVKPGDGLESYPWSSLVD